MRDLSKKIMSLACEGKGEGRVIRKKAGIASSDYLVQRRKEKEKT